MSTRQQAIDGIVAATATLNAAKDYIAANPPGVPDPVLADLATAVAAVNAAITPPPQPGA